MEKWNPNIRTGHRLVWALCWDIPLAAWDVAHIRKIVAAIGDLVEVDHDVEELRRLDRARVLIRTPWRPTLQHTVNLHIGGELYQVHIVEEKTTDSRKCVCQARSSLSSSEEISSTDGDTDSPIPNFVGALGTDYTPRGIDGNSTAVGMPKGNAPFSNVPLPNGTNTDDEPGDKNHGTRKLRIDNQTSVSALGALIGMAPVAHPVSETMECCENEETTREEREPCDGNRLWQEGLTT